MKSFMSSIRMLIWEEKSWTGIPESLLLIRMLPCAELNIPPWMTTFEEFEKRAIASTGKVYYQVRWWMRNMPQHRFRTQIVTVYYRVRTSFPSSTSYACSPQQSSVHFTLCDTTLHDFLSIANRFTQCPNSEELFLFRFFLVFGLTYIQWCQRTKGAPSPHQPYIHPCILSKPS